MAWYDYHCKFCGHDEIDIQRKITENVSIYECPNCKEEMVQKIGGFMFELKGKMWASDGYSSKGIEKIDTKKESS